KNSIKRYKPGIPTDPTTTMGSIVSKVQYDRVLGYIEAGKQDGARLLSGGKRPSDPLLAKGFYVEPTVFADVTMDMRIGKEEIFGPVLSVLKWSDEEKMLAQVNQVERPDLLDLDQRSRDRASRGGSRRGGVRVDQRGLEAFPRRALRRLQAIGRRTRGRHRGAAELHAREEHPRQPQAARRRALMLPDHARVGCPARGIATISRKNRSCLWEESTDGAQPSAHDRVVTVRKRDHCSAQNTSAATLSVQSELLCSPEGLMRLIPQFNVNGQFTRDCPGRC